MSGQGLKDPVKLVKVLGESDGYWNPSPKGTIACLECLITSVSGSYIQIRPLPVTDIQTEILDGNIDRVIRVGNFRDNVPVVGKYYLVFLLGNGYVIDNQATFLEYQ